MGCIIDSCVEKGPKTSHWPFSTFLKLSLWDYQVMLSLGRKAGLVLLALCCISEPVPTIRKTIISPLKIKVNRKADLAEGQSLDSRMGFCTLGLNLWKGLARNQAEWAAHVWARNRERTYLYARQQSGYEHLGIWLRRAISSCIYGEARKLLFTWILWF